MPPDFSEPSGFILPLYQLTTINGHQISPSTHGVSIAGTTLSSRTSLGAVSSAPLSLESSALTEGSILNPSAPPIVASHQLVTFITGQTVAADTTAIILPNSTSLTAGARGLTLNGTIIALNTAGELVVGSDTVTLAMSPSTTSMGGSIMGWFGATEMPSSHLPQALSPTNVLAPPTFQIGSSLSTSTNGIPRTTIQQSHGAAGHAGDLLGRTAKSLIDHRDFRPLAVNRPIEEPLYRRQIS